MRFALELEAFFHAEQDFADAEQADDRDQEVDAPQQFGPAEGKAQLPLTVSMPIWARPKPSIRAMMVLNGSLPVPTKLPKVSR